MYASIQIASENLACPQGLYKISFSGAAKEPEEPLSFSAGSDALGCSNRSTAGTAREGRAHQRAITLPGPWPWTARLERSLRSNYGMGWGVLEKRGFGGGWMGLSILQGLGMSHGTLEGKMWLFIPN